MSDRSRRELLRWIGASAAAPTLAGAQAPAVRTQGRAYFSDAEAAFVTAAVDRLIPADNFPSASQAGVVDYIDRQLAGPFGRGERIYLSGPFERGTPQQGYQLGLTPAQVYREAVASLLADTIGQDFARRAAEEQDALLKRLEAGAWMLGRVPSAVFFETLLANTIEGYFADPMYGGNRGMVGWRMIGFPGAYANYVQWVGRHDIRFNRPPMSIAMHVQAGPSGAHSGHSAPGAELPTHGRSFKPAGGVR